MAARATFRRFNPNLYNKPSGQGAFQFEGTDTAVPVGDLTMSFDKSSTKSEIRSNESPDRPIVATDYSEQSGMVKIVFRQLGVLGKALAFMGKDKPYTQPAVDADGVVFKNVTALNWIELREVDEDNKVLAAAQGLIKTVVTAVKVGPVPLLKDKHYRHVPHVGVVQILEWPEGLKDGDDVIVSYSAPAIDAAANISVVDILSELVMRGRLIVAQNNLRGINRKFIFPRIAAGGDSGSVNVISDSNDVVTVEVTATIEDDETQPEGRGRGYIVDIDEDEEA